MHGKIGAAMKLLDKEGCTGFLPLSDETIKGLKSKHPEPFFLFGGQGNSKRR